MVKRVLVTGGAGFIGSHLVDALVQAGHSVRVFDSLEPQVHGDLRERGEWPAYRNPAAEYVLGDVRDLAELDEAADGAVVVYHFAAATGVGQSMYQVAHYTAVNVQGTANLLQALSGRAGQVEKLVLASSRAVYGEGLYGCPQCGPVTPPVRSPEALENKIWEVTCPACSGPLQPLPTPETKPLAPGTVYAITKQTQEQLVTCFSQAYGLAAVVLRFFNVYGPRQSLSNPYTGILTTFLQRLWNGQPPQVYEDGLMGRDFVEVADVVRACLLALDADQSMTINVGSGATTTILEVARRLSEMVRPELEPEVVGLARVGDIRHCSADLTRAAQLLGYQPAVSLEEGLRRLVQSTAGHGVVDQSAAAREELKKAGLLK